MSTPSLAFAILTGIFLSISLLALFLANHQEAAVQGQPPPWVGLALLGLLLGMACFAAFWISYLATGGGSPLPA
ncbi:MAG: hypothetical protein RLY93_10765 [Sumerlaeia bacterium]